MIATWRGGERVFSRTVATAGAVTLLALTAVVVFLAAHTVPVLADDTFWAYVAPLVFGTVWVAVLALCIATPAAIGIALFSSHYVSRRYAAPLGTIVELLAAVPSVVFGLWGITVLAPAVQPVYVWLNEHLGWLVLFSGVVSGTGRTTLTAALVLAVMVLPVIAALCREVFLSTPALHEEAALALGATRWEMIRLAVFPFARAGMVSAVLLGLGRALGETMAVAMVLSATGAVSFQLLTPENPATIAANIALTFPEAHGAHVSTLIATGMILFAVTLLMNALARGLIERKAAVA